MRGWERTTRSTRALAASGEPKVLEFIHPEARAEIVSRFYLPPELRLGLAAAGFEIAEERGSLSGAPLLEGCREVVLLARSA